MGWIEMHLGTKPAPCEWDGADWGGVGWGEFGIGTGRGGAPDLKLGRLVH